MIVITRRLAKRLKTVFRQALHLTGRANLPTIQLAAGADGLHARCHNGRAAAEFHLAGEQPEQTLCIPFDLLSDIEGGREVPVEISSQDGKATATWQAGSVPQFVEQDAPTVLSENWPPTPEAFNENPSDLLGALRDAAQVTDAASSRFALGCVQFRGSEGDIVATDGRQALIQEGFHFPWDDDLLVPASKVFGSKQLPNDELVLVGRTEDWATFRVGPWTLWFSIETEARFPDVAAQIRKPSDATACCTIAPGDRQFLLDNVLRLPGDNDHNQPVTLDLNGSVAIRGKRSDETPGTELILAASSRAGEAIRFNTDRRHLHRAAQLGFEQLHVYDDKSPVMASDERRQYIWALLEPGAAIAHEDNAVRIESQVSEPDSTIQATHPPRRPPLTKSTPQQGNVAAIREPNDEPEPLDPITAAETLRDSLRQSLQSTTALVRTLKRHRKRTKAVESTLLSLRQLQAIDA